MPIPPWSREAIQAAVALRAAALEYATAMLQSQESSPTARARLSRVVRAAYGEEVSAVQPLFDIMTEVDAEAEIDELYEQLAAGHDDVVFARLRSLQESEARRLIDDARKSMRVAPGELSSTLNDVRKRLDARTSRDDEPAR